MNYESEANDTQSSADALTLGAAMTGQLSSYSDTDWYSFTVGAAGTLSLTFDGPNAASSYSYYTLGVYNASGALFDAVGNRAGRDVPDGCSPKCRYLLRPGPGWIQLQQRQLLPDGEPHTL